MNLFKKDFKGYFRCKALIYIWTVLERYLFNLFSL